MQPRFHAYLERVSWGRHWSVLAVTGLLLVASGAPGAAHGADGNPARIHVGSCEQLGAVAFPLNGVGSSVDLNDAAVAAPTAVNPDRAATVAVSETTIDAPLDAIVGAEHALMIYESDEDMSGIACGNIGGAMVGEQLVVGLSELGTSGNSGFVLFAPDGEQTTVTILLGHDLASGSGAAEAGDDPEEGEHEDAVPHDEAATPEADGTPEA